MKGRRKTTSIRLPDELMGRIRVAAEERDLSVNCLYGATPQLACDHGCQPTITHEHASALTREMFGIEES